jgi:hypothetical protein
VNRNQLLAAQWDSARSIIAACGCHEEDAGVVEQIMLARNGAIRDVLDLYDPLKPGRFKREAKIACELLEILRAEDPSGDW